MRIRILFTTFLLVIFSGYGLTSEIDSTGQTKTENPAKKSPPEDRLTDEEVQATSSNGTTFINWMMGILFGGFLIVISFIIWKNMRK